MRNTTEEILPLFQQQHRARLPESARLDLEKIDPAAGVDQIPDHISSRRQKSFQDW